MLAKLASVGAVAALLLCCLLVGAGAVTVTSFSHADSCSVFERQVAAKPMLAEGFRATMEDLGCDSPWQVHHGGRRRLLEDSSTVAAADAEGSAIGGDDADARDILEVYNPATKGRYVVIIATNGSFTLNGAKLETSRDSSGKAVASMLVYSIGNSTLDEVVWSSNLQRKASSEHFFDIKDAAVHPTTGNLILVGEYTGTLVMGDKSVTASSSIGAFVAIVSAADGSVLLAESYEGEGRESAQAVACSADGCYVAGNFGPKGITFPGSTAILPTRTGMANGGGLFLIKVEPNQDTKLSVFDLDARYVSDMRIQVINGSGLLVAVSVAGPATLYVGNAQATITAQAKGTVIFKTDLTGFPANVLPLVIKSASNDAPQLLLNDMKVQGDNVYVAASFVGDCTFGSVELPMTTDAYGDGLLLAARVEDLASLWYATLSGPGSQEVHSIAAKPDGSGLYAVGGAWSPTAVTLTVRPALGSGGASQSFTSRIRVAGEGAIAMQLGADGTPGWVKLVEGWQDQRMTATLQAPARLYVAGLLDRGSPCKTMNGSQVCAPGGTKRGAYVSLMMVDKEEEGGGVIAAHARAASATAGIIAGSVVGGVVLLCVIAGVIYLLVAAARKRSRKATTPNAPLMAGAATTPTATPPPVASV